MVRSERFELSTTRLKVLCSLPTELRAHIRVSIANLPSLAATLFILGLYPVVGISRNLQPITYRIIILENAYGLTIPTLRLIFYNFNLTISIEILVFCRTLRHNNTLNLMLRPSNRLIQSHPRVFSIFKSSGIQTRFQSIRLSCSVKFNVPRRIL